MAEFKRMSLSEGIANLRKVIEPDTKPDETNLVLEKREFFEKMKKEKNGWDLLELLESGECQVAERLGLCKSEIKDCVIYFRVPSWNQLVAHLTIVNGV